MVGMCVCYRCVWKECSFVIKGVGVRESVACDSCLDGMCVCCRCDWKECSFVIKGVDVRESVACDSCLDGICVCCRRVWKECSFMIRGIASCYKTAVSKVKKKPPIPTPETSVYKWML